MAGLGVQREISVTALVKRIEGLEDRVQSQEMVIRKLRETQYHGRPVSLWEHIFGVKADLNGK